ncbi:hypothetical protein EJA72_25350 [Pseudomonas sp. PB120]|uniref:hypothetical protein n=1 Tax=Pseudomonas sp. PB120 TaxID=2494700 RepID=UPI0012FDBCAA|nr:hypothetical protein [Pseudomonas sp. PB120]MVV51544.1 hypothetical protein [Pseudomonas sp. PB120]
MTGFKNLLLAFTVLSASTAALASDDMFASPALGKTSDKVKKSHTLIRSSIEQVAGNDSVWGARLGQPGSERNYSASYDNVSVSHNGIKLREEDLMGRYDLS